MAEEATDFAGTLHRHGDPDPSKWEEQKAVTGRPNDTPLDGDDVEYAVPNSTMAERAAARKSAEKKQVKAEDIEDKAITTATTKTARKRK